MEDLPITAAPEPVDPDAEPIPENETPLAAKQRESRERQRKKHTHWRAKRKKMLAERRAANAPDLPTYPAGTQGHNLIPNQPGQVIPPRNGKLLRANSEVIRRFLEDSRKKSVNAEGQTRLIRMIENMFNIATSARSALSVQAFNALMDRAYGKAKPSEEELGAIKDGGFKLIYVQPPEISPEQIEQFKELPAPKPDFIEGEIVEEGEDGRN